MAKLLSVLSVNGVEQHYFDVSRIVARSVLTTPDYQLKGTKATSVTKGGEYTREKIEEYIPSNNTTFLGTKEPTSDHPSAEDFSFKAPALTFTSPGGTFHSLTTITNPISTSFNDASFFAGTFNPVLASDAPGSPQTIPKDAAHMGWVKEADEEYPEIKYSTLAEVGTGLGVYNFRVTNGGKIKPSNLSSVRPKILDGDVIPFVTNGTFTWAEELELTFETTSFIESDNVYREIFGITSGGTGAVANAVDLAGSYSPDFTPGGGGTTLGLTRTVPKNASSMGWTKDADEEYPTIAYRTYVDNTQSDANTKVGIWGLRVVDGGRIKKSNVANIDIKLASGDSIQVSTGQTFLPSADFDIATSVSNINGDFLTLPDNPYWKIMSDISESETTHDFTDAFETAPTSSRSWWVNVPLDAENHPFRKHSTETYPTIEVEFHTTSGSKDFSIRGVRLKAGAANKGGILDNSREYMKINVKGTWAIAGENLVVNKDSFVVVAATYNYSFRQIDIVNKGRGFLDAAGAEFKFPVGVSNSQAQATFETQVFQREHGISLTLAGVTGTKGVKLSPKRWDEEMSKWLNPPASGQHMDFSGISRRGFHTIVEDE